jgi:hypothetical protein
MSISEFVGRFFAGGNPAFPEAPNEIYGSLGRDAIYQLAESLKTNPSFFDGLSGGVRAAQHSVGAGMSGFADQLRKQQDQQLDIKSKMLEIERKRQEIANSAENQKRDKRKMEIEEEKHAESKRLAPTKELQEKEELEAKRLANKKAKELSEKEARYAESALAAASSFARTPEEAMLYSGLATAGQYKELFDAIRDRNFHQADPNRERWGDPKYLDGVGIVQENQYGNVKVLNADDKPDKESQITPSITEINKMKIDILTREIIPRWAKNNPQLAGEDENSGLIDSLMGMFGGTKPAAKPSEPMTEYNGRTIPVRLLEEANDTAISRYVSTINSAKQKLNGTSVPDKKQPPASSINSVGAKNVANRNLSSQLALQGAIADKINKAPQYRAMSGEERQAMIKQIYSEIKAQVESGQGSYEDAVRSFQ